MNDSGDVAPRRGAARLNVLAAAGEMGERIRRHDWSSTPLGPLEDWPQSLFTLVELMLGSSQPACVAWGPELTSLYNDHFASILGHYHPVALGRPYWSMWTDEAWETHRPIIEATIRGAAQQLADQPVALAGRPDRPRSWFTFSWTPVRNEAGAVAGFYCAAMETTDKLLAEQQAERRIADLVDTLRGQLDEQEALLNALPVGVFISRDPQSREIKMNAAGAAMLRIPLGANASKTGPEGNRLPFRVFRNGVEVAGDDLPMQRASRLGESVVGEEYEVRFDDGSAIELFEHARPILDSSGRVRGSVGVFVDITERKRAEEALQEADRRKDEFLATLAHELRNPLAPIRNAVRILKANGVSEVQREWSRDIIDRQVYQMARLLDDLLDVSRITRGKLELRKEIVSIHSAVEAAVETARPLLEARGHDFRVEAPDEPLLVSADPVRMTQILGNLLTNAAKYTDVGGRILVQVDSEEAHVVVRVRDDGIGLRPEQISRLFVMFSQAPEAIQRSEGGLGVGLAITRGLVELHGGRITARSDGTGKGSEFVVRLPLVKDCRADSPASIGDR